MLYHFGLGFLLWAIFIFYSKKKGVLTETRFHYSYMIIIFGFLSAFVFLTYGLMLLWDKLGKVIIK